MKVEIGSVWAAVAFVLGSKFVVKNFVPCGYSLSVERHRIQVIDLDWNQ